MDRRKTQEEKVVSRPSNRISRLVQPRKYSATPLSLNRNQSRSSENVASYNRQANKRARSATPHIPSETPVRPPLARSLSSLFTPASTSKNVFAKKPVSENVTHILEVLRRHFGANFLPGGLQSMTAKQFVEIIRFFAQNICGDKIAIQDNNVDDVKRFVDFMEYPHQMNKSWFKAPTVSIAYDRNVEFLDWLCDFVSIGGGGDSSTADDVEYKITESGDFGNLVDLQFIGNFVADLRNGFVIWSDRTNEFDDWKSKWIHQIITAKTGLEDIDVSIDRVENEYKSLQTKETSYGNEQLLETQQRKSDELTEKLSQLSAEVEEKDIDFQETSNELDRLTSEHAVLLSRVSGIKEIIKSQKCSVEDRNAIVGEMNQKKHELLEREKFVTSIKAIADDYQVKIARLRQQKTSKVFGINRFIQKLFQIGISFGDNLTINQLSIHENDTKEEIKTKLDLITQIKQIVNERRCDIHASSNEAQTKLTSISNDLYVIEDEVVAQKKRLHSVEIQMQKIDNQIVDKKYASEQHQQQLQTKIDNLQETYEEIKLKIKNAEKVAESLREENKKIYQGIELKTSALLKAKVERQERQEAAIAELEQLTDQLKDAVKNLK